MITLRAGERTVALLMFAYSFLAMTAWNILRPLTRSKFISDLGADNAPYVMLVAGVLIGLLMHQYTRAIRRLPRSWVIPSTQIGIIALLVAFWVLMRTGAVWVGVAFYCVGLILGLLLISQFWTLANDIYDARQAKRLFGFIGGGASLGGALGAKITSLAVRQVGAGNMVLVAAGVLAACTVVVMLILRRHHMRTTADLGLEEEGVSGREALKLLRESSHVKVIAVVIGFAAAGAQIIDQQLIMVAEAINAAGDENAIAAFLADIQFYVSLAGFVVQITLTRWIHRSFGLGAALLLLPVALGGSAAVILLTGAVWATGFARVTDATLRYTVDKTTREVLFLPLPAELKYRAKPFIDVTADRFAKAAAALLLIVLIKPWGFGLDWRSLSYASLTVMAIWIVAALFARREYLKAFRQSIGDQSIAADAIRTEVADDATIETLVEELSNPDPSAVLYAIGMLETFDKRNLISPLLLQHDAPAVRARALGSLSAVRSRIAVRWKPHVERLLHDQDVDVRAAALRALAALSHEDAVVLMRRHLSDPEPRVAVTAAVGLANTNEPAHLDAAEVTLKRLAEDVREAAAPSRREVAIALARVRAPRFRPLLVPLLYDFDATVVGAAIGSARALGPSDGLFLPGLTSLLGHRTLKAAARDALVGYGDAAVPALAHVLLDAREHAWVRRHIPATLAAIPSQASMDALVAALDDHDGFLRYKAIAALEHLHRTHPDLACPSASVERLLLQEASRYCNFLTLQHDFARGVREQRSLLVGTALEEKLARTLDRIYRLLGLLYQSDNVAAARHTLRHGEARRRAAAVEYLDNLLKGAVRKRVLPLLDETSPAEKLRHAYLVLKTRPRDLEDTLARILHEDDPILATTAVHFVARHQRWSLADDLHFVLRHRPPDDRVLMDAASWALALRAGAVEDSEPPRPIVELAHRLRTLPLFEFVSIDELFRITALGEETHHPPGRELSRPGAAQAAVEFILEGAVAVALPSGGVREIDAPAVIGFEDVLRGVPASSAVLARGLVVSMQVPADAFLTLVADNAVIAGSLFGMLMADASRAGLLPIAPPPDEARPPLLQPMDLALALREHPLLARATPAQLLALVSAAREVPLTAGQVLFEAEDPAALFQIIDGEIAMELPTGQHAARAGTTLCLAETLAGTSAGARARVTRAGRAWRLRREDLFGVLTDHVDLMQEIAGEVLVPTARPSPAA